MPVGGRMSIEDKMKVFNKLRSGGEWLGTARTWMQSNVPKGDTLNWGSTELITIPFLQTRRVCFTCCYCCCLSL